MYNYFGGNMEYKIIALIPSLEPDNNLVELIKKISKTEIIPIVVNDGSSKEYDKIFKKLKCKVLSYDTNMGKGYALKYGLQYIIKNYTNYIVVTMDSDGQHTVEDALKISKYVEDNPDTLVIGSRKRGKNTPLRSYFGNTITRIIYRGATSIEIYDTQSGLRAFSSDIVPYMLEIKGNRFEYEMNVLLNSKRNNIKIKEIDIQTIYINKNSGSHFNTIKDSFKIYKEIFKFSFISIICFIIDFLLYIFFNVKTKNFIISNILARIVSSTINYLIDRKLVFKSTKKNINNLLEYFIFTLVVLAFNTCIVTGFSFFINKYFAKIIAEIILFFFSYIIQDIVSK